MLKLIWWIFMSGYIEKMLKKLGNKLLKKFDKTLSFEGALKDL